MEGIQMSTYLLDGVEALIGDHQMSVSGICGELEGYWGWDLSNCSSSL